MIRTLIFCLLATLATELAAADDWRPLLSPQLSENWELWLGKLHPKTSLPESLASMDRSKPVGLIDVDNDPFSLVSMIETDGLPTLHLSGEIYAGLTTLETFENYHISLQFKWGDKKWPPRENRKRDSGLLLHCIGPHGALWGIWMATLECQIQEGDCGDLYSLGGPKGLIRARKPAGSKAKPIYDPTSTKTFSGDIQHAPSTEAPHGEWNTVEAYVLGDTLVFVVNGTPNMAIHQATHKGNPLTKGKIQLQSEAAEVFYRDVKIRPITEFPDSLAEHVRPLD